MRYQVAIVGGGVGGMILARHATGQDGYSESEVRIFDPFDPGHWFSERIRDCQTDHLRSGADIHTDREPDSLRRFARETGRAGAFRDGRPCAKLFCDHVAEVARMLSGMHIRSQVSNIERVAGGLKLTHQAPGSREVRHSHAERVVLALGPGEPNYPAWAYDLRDEPQLMHVFRGEFERSNVRMGSRVAVIGGGSSAVQVALALATEGHRPHLMTRNPFAEREASDPGDWVPGSRLLAELHALPWENRMAFLRSFGDKGTIPKFEQERFAEALAANRVMHTVCTVQACSRAGCLQLTLTDGAAVEYDQIVLSTGFRRKVPYWLRGVAERLGLPRTAAGEPILTENLEWGEGSCVYLMGGFAAPIVGPYADNMIGARAAAQIIVPALREACAA